VCLEEAFVDKVLHRTPLNADHATACEAPPDFDWARVIERVRNIQPEVESITGREFEIDENVQDASFFTDLATCDCFPRHVGLAALEPIGSRVSSP
jgi:hypothetical protein